MVEYSLKLNTIFSSLADKTRRDIIKRVSKKQLSVGQIAGKYNISFAGVSKHLKVLEKAKLVIKHRRGKEQMVSVSPNTLATVSNYLDNYKQLWENRLDSLDRYLKIINKPPKRPKGHLGGSPAKREKGKNYGTN